MAPFLQLVRIPAEQEYLGVKFSTQKQVAVAITLALSGLTVGCAQRPEFAAGQSSFQDRSLPFHADGVAKKRSVNLAPLLAEVASGTPIQVRLESSLSSAHAMAGDSFQAVLDEPLIWKGQTIAPKGSLLRGKVLEAKPSEPSREAGYLRLALTSISIESKVWPLQTSSVFVKGATYEREATILPVQLASSSKNLVPAVTIQPQHIQVRDDAGISATRLLTFHLSQPVTVAHGGQ
ncbi:MAG TPA: hypothetical protein VH088_02745 [Terriglobales bacterium]|nr:hypothetical protein [Terriglobales bacterium]